MREELLYRVTKGHNISDTLVRTEGKMRNIASAYACFNWQRQIMWRLFAIICVESEGEDKQSAEGNYISDRE